MIAQAEFALDLPPSPPESFFKTTERPVATEIRAIGGDNASALTEDDLIDFSDAEKRIIDLMKDGRWYGDEQIIYVSQQREGLRRLRNLRKRGYTVEARRVGKNRGFEYRLIKP
jgi:hypothetical protein